MSELIPDVGYVSLNKFGEQLCGDHVEIVDGEDGSLVVVLADGLGSGVKASILSTLTAKIISTMMANGLSLADCVDTIAATLPVCSERQVAYSTFTILRFAGGRTAQIIQFDNPHVILLRDGRPYAYPQDMVEIDGKKIYQADLDLMEHDTFVAFSDGALHASVGPVLDLTWDRWAIGQFLETMYDPNATAKTVSSLLAGECRRLYGGRPGDDTTVCTVRLRRRQTVSLMLGPSRDPDDEEGMLASFFAEPGKHIVSGGTTSALAARHLGRELDTSLPAYVDPEIPPTAKLEGVDLVTEGVVTLSRVVEYAQDYLGDNARYAEWGYKKDGASLAARMLFEEATDVNLYIGRAVNPAHQAEGLPIGFDRKMQIADQLSDCLKRMGKAVKTYRF
ncbi:SpoIIE family protein phosphatase [Pseudoflavonifractor capillosus]|uniref:Serine/threonine-protein phosphatase n=1 Tax=Pseudoflavonifractor capillosus TaxID=106588 RepID=A0A921MND0_9FIRM|nr:SpoIIE family protein phosphatase [Pseudoflavonifractor capillosus]HJG87417.1 serine/threonine-protein phosphatase [Pseudoflavonifractor capillosus]